MATNSTTDNADVLDKLLKEINALESVVSGFDERERMTVQALQRAIEALHKEALSRLIRRLKSSGDATAILKEAVSDEVVYTVFRHLEVLKPSLNERLEAALNGIRPMLAGHGGDVELVSVEPPDTVSVRFIGACNNCPASELTFSEGVEKAIKEHCPEITTIKKAKGICTSGEKVDFVSPFARADQDNWLFAAQLSAVPEDSFAVFEVGGQSVLLARVDDRVVCYQNACAHLGMPLDSAELNAGVLRCTYHNFEYLLKSGECLTAPEVQLHTHAVRVVDESVEVSLS